MPIISEAHNPYKGAWVFQKLPQIQDKGLYWMIMYTNEVFTEFEEFVRRVEIYQSRIWSCKITGKSSLTYQEALESEKEMRSSLKDFPSGHVKLLLEMVHGNQDQLEILSNKICKRLQQMYESNDIVRWKGEDGESG